MKIERLFDHKIGTDDLVALSFSYLLKTCLRFKVTTSHGVFFHQSEAFASLFV